MAQIENQSDLVRRIIEAGHKPRLDEGGRVDDFALSYEHHNGPACEICHESWCEHCDQSAPIVPCIGREEVERRAKEYRRKQYEILKAEFEPQNG